MLSHYTEIEKCFSKVFRYWLATMWVANNAKRANHQILRYSNSRRVRKFRVLQQAQHQHQQQV